MATILLFHAARSTKINFTTEQNRLFIVSLSARPGFRKKYTSKYGQLLNTRLYRERDIRPPHLARNI